MILIVYQFKDLFFFEMEPYILDKNNQYSENKDDNNSTIVSKILEESLIKSDFNGNRETWDDICEKYFQY